MEQKVDNKKKIVKIVVWAVVIIAHHGDHAYHRQQRGWLGTYQAIARRVE